MLNLKMPVLEADKFILRPIESSDAKDMFEYAHDPEVLKYLWWEAHANLEQSQESIQNHFLNRMENGIPEAYAIVYKENNKMIGTIDFHTVFFDDVGVIGYALNKNYWGQQIVTEALKMMILVGFHHCGFYRIEINHCVDNIGSLKVIEKAGFILEGEMRQRKVERDGHRAPYRYYGLLKDDDIVKERYTRENYEKYLR